MKGLQIQSQALEIYSPHVFVARKNSRIASSLSFRRLVSDNLLQRVRILSP